MNELKTQNKRRWIGQFSIIKPSADSGVRLISQEKRYGSQARC
jgi:hypothetical protein